MPSTAIAAASARRTSVVDGEPESASAPAVAASPVTSGPTTAARVDVGVDEPSFAVVRSPAGALV
jgi:hypothetical protein